MLDAQPDAQPDAAPSPTCEPEGMGPPTLGADEIAWNYRIDGSAGPPHMAGRRLATSEDVA